MMALTVRDERRLIILMIPLSPVDASEPIRLGSGKKKWRMSGLKR